MELVEGVSFLEFVCPDPTLPAEDTLDPIDVGEADRSTQRDSGPEGLPAEGANPRLSPTDADSTPRLGSTESTNAGAEVRLDQTDPITAGSSRLGSTEIDPEASPPPGPGPVAPESTARGSESESPMPSTEAEPVACVPVPPPGRPAVRRPDYTRLRAALRHLAEVLNELHAQGRLHRDIKPSNVLVTRQGRVVLLDFGLSKDVEARADPETTEGGHSGRAVLRTGVGGVQGG